MVNPRAPIAARLLISLVLAVASFSALPSAVRAVSYGPCVSNPGVNLFMYTEKSSTSRNVRNVRAAIQVSSPVNQFRPCGVWNYTLLAPDGSSGWVSLEPGNLNPKNGDLNAILQIGVIACDELFLAACASGQIRYFWAEGNCGLSIPSPQDLGVADTSSHVYEIRRWSNGDYDLRRDFVSKIRFAPSTHTNVNCWLPYNLEKAQWAFERWDRGDGVGDGTHKGTMNPAYFMWDDPGDSGIWVSPGFSFCTAQPTSYPGLGQCTWGSNYLEGWDYN
jgi:hypothetical protein